MQKVSPKNNAAAVSLAEIGGKLKTAREKKGVTIDQAQRQTHIHSTVLVSLESGLSDEVLTPTYVKSFLKKYSLYLALDSNQLVKEYAMLHPDLDSSSRGLGEDRVIVKRRKGAADYFRIIRIVGAIAVCIFLLVITVRGASRFIKAHSKSSAKKVSVQTKETRATQAKISEKKTVSKPPVSQVSIPDNEPITLVMKVKTAVYVGVKRDGALLFKRLLPKGTVETVTASGKLNISIAKARSVELVLNGRPLDTAGKGAIRDLEITRKGVKVK